MPQKKIREMAEQSKKLQDLIDERQRLKKRVDEQLKALRAGTATDSPPAKKSN